MRGELMTNLSKHLPSIFMGAGVGLSALTTVEAVKATPEAYSLIQGEDLTLIEKAKRTYKCYTVPACAFAASLACFGFAMKGYNSQIADATEAAIAASYFAQKYKDYRAKNIELHGKECDKEVIEAIVKDQMAKNPPVVSTGYSGKYHVYDPVTDQYFYATYKELEHAEHEMNRILPKESTVKYNYLLSFFKEADHTLDRGEIIGWFMDDTYEEYHYWSASFFGVPCMELSFNKVDIDGEDIYYLGCSVDPLMEATWDYDIAKDAQDLQAL